jgi:mono/diheme cytochrome c family protein
MLALPAAVAACLLLATGCGQGGSQQTVDSEGAVLFHEAGCADCHALAAAGARARVGSDLDSARPSYSEVVSRMELGGSGMPSFAGKLTEDQAEALASFVSSATEPRDDVDDVALAAGFVADGTRVRECGSSFACLEQAFGNIAFADGPKRALDELTRVSAVNSAARADCHRIAHTIGAAALARYRGSAGQAFAEGSSACASGYYHGIAERALSEAPSGDLAPVARDLCGSPSVRRTTFLAYQCVHGLGHGLMIATGYDLPRSLETCDQLREEWDRTSCTGGVFMENITSSYGIQSRWLRDDDPLYPCQAVADRHKLYCYLMVTSRILPLVGYDFAAASATCMESEGEWVATCFQSLGRDASGQARGDAGQILKLCGEAGPWASDCLYGAARDLGNTDAATPRAEALCSRAAERLRDTCFNGIGTIVRELHDAGAARARACASLSAPEHLRSTCRRGAGLTP